MAKKKNNVGKPREGKEVREVYSIRLEPTTKKKILDILYIIVYNNYITK